MSMIFCRRRNPQRENNILVKVRIPYDSLNWDGYRHQIVKLDYETMIITLNKVDRYLKMNTLVVTIKRLT